MAVLSLQEILQDLILEQPSHVGALANAVDQGLCGALSRLRFDLSNEEGVPNERLISDLESFGKAVGNIGVYYAILVDYYNEICRVVDDPQLKKILPDPYISEPEEYATRHLLLTRALSHSIPKE